MPEPNEAYRAGYEKGKTDNLGGSLAEITMGMLRDDPGGYYAAGYYDGAGGRKFNVHGSKDTKAAPRKPSAPSLPSPLESQWYRLCDESEFIPKETVDRCVATLNAAGSQVAAIIGLSAFTDHTCPRCGKTGHFKIHFLGRLGHPGACGWEGYMNTGSYIGHQIAQIFHTGARAAGAMQDEADRKGKERNWMHSVLGFLVVAIFRAASAVVLIPLHCVAALSQPGQTRADIAPRVITLVVFLTGIGVGIYALQRASRPQFPISQQYAPQQQVYTPPQAPTIQFTPGSGSSPTAQQQNRDSVVAATSRLIEAIDRHDLVAARSALDQGADPNMTCAEAGRAQAACGDTETPLHFSVVPDRLVGPPEPGQFPTGIDMIRLLLEHGADPNRRGGFPGHGTTTAFRHVILWTDTNYGAGYPSPAIISLMLAHGADPTLDNPMQDVLACANKPGQYPEVAKSCSELLDLLRGQSAGVRQMPQMQSVIKPSFDCAKASTAVELLICRDGSLAALEVQMATAYHQALDRMPPDRRKLLQQEHLTWFRNYGRTCNNAQSEADRTTCVANFLTARAAELNSQR